MFPFNQGGGSELSFQADGNPGEEEEAQDLNLDNELLAVVNLNTTSSASTTITFSSTHLAPPAPADRGSGGAGGSGRHRRAQGDSTGGGCRDGFDEDPDRMRKMQHRDIERQRRHEMSSLLSNLRTLLPPQYVKGKRSTSDHIEESANYIKNLQGRIKVLGDTRDRLRLHESSTTSTNNNPGSHGSHHSTTSTIASSSRSSSSSSSSSIPNNVEVFMNSGSLHVQISSSAQREDGPRLSTALKVLLEAGLDVVSCVTNKVIGGGLVHNIHCDLATNMGQGEIDVQQLQQRLYQVVCSHT